MAKLADLLQESVKNSIALLPSVRMGQLAQKIHVDTKRAEELFAQYGDGYIYARGGLVMPDTEHTRRNVLAHYGYYIAFVDGVLRVIDTNGQRIARQKRARIAAARERHAIERDAREYAEKRRLDAFFRSGQGKASVKRGGKANSHDDIGKYVPHYCSRIGDMEQRVKARIITINVKDV